MNTIQVRWDVPLELVQYRQSIAPPPLPTNPPLPSDPPPSANGPGQPSIAPNQPNIGSAQPAIGPQLPPHLGSGGNSSENPANMIGPQQPLMPSKPSHTSGGKTSLIAYDDSDSETDEKVAEQEPSKISETAGAGKDEHTTDDILALLEAEKPPDYLAPQANTTTNQTNLGTANPIATPSNGTCTNGVGSQYPGNHYTSGPPPSASAHQFSAPPPPVAVSQPPLPVRRPQLGSMLQVCS